MSLTSKLFQLTTLHERVRDHINESLNTVQTSAKGCSEESVPIQCILRDRRLVVNIDAAADDVAIYNYIKAFLYNFVPRAFASFHARCY